MTRDWADVHKADRCRVCGATRYELAATGHCLDLAHTIGRKYDQPHPRTRYQKDHGGELYVHPDSVVTLCGPSTDRHSCHGRFDGHELDIRPYLTDEQIAWAVDRLGHGAAMRALAGRDWT